MPVHTINIQSLVATVASVGELQVVETILWFLSIMQSGLLSKQYSFTVPAHQTLDFKNSSEFFDFNRAVLRRPVRLRQSTFLHITLLDMLTDF